jgi:hypothetical protein
MEPKPYSLACLYTAPVPRIDFDQIAAAISKDENLSELLPTIITRLPAKLVSFDFNGQFTIQVLIGNQPLEESTFGIALQGAKATTVENNFARIVSRHTGHVTVTAAAEERESETDEQRLLRIYALQMVTEFLYTFGKPDLLYSSMAESLVLPCLNPRSYRGELDSRIFEQAVLFARRAQVGDGAPVGANIWGSEALLGRPVSFTPVSFPSWAVTTGATKFFEYCDANGIPKDGETITNNKNSLEYLITHTPKSVNYPLGTYNVTIQRFDRADQRDENGELLYPDLLSQNPVISRKKHSTPKRKSERSPLHSFMILLMAIGLTFGIAAIIAYWRTTNSGG